MIYLFSEIRINGIIIPLEGAAEFHLDPNMGDPNRHRPFLLIEGFEPSNGMHPKRKAIDLDLGATGNGLLDTLYKAIRVDLVANHWQAICRQWLEESHHLDEAARFDAWHAQRAA